MRGGGMPQESFKLPLPRTLTFQMALDNTTRYASTILLLLFGGTLAAGFIIREYLNIEGWKIFGSSPTCSHLETVARIPNTRRTFHSMTRSKSSSKYQPQSASGSSHYGNLSWDNKLLPENGGYIVTRGKGEGIEYLGISMFHQLHCLTMMREELYAGGQHSHVSENGTEKATQSKSSRSTEVQMHLGHCFDYIAQAILCAADDTIEPPKTRKTKDGDDATAIDGMGNLHYCFNAEVLWDIAESSERSPRPYWGVEQGDSVHSIFTNHK